MQMLTLTKNDDGKFDLSVMRVPFVAGRDAPLVNKRSLTAKQAVNDVRAFIARD